MTTEEIIAQRAYEIAKNEFRDASREFQRCPTNGTYARMTQAGRELVYARNARYNVSPFTRHDFSCLPRF